MFASANTKTLEQTTVHGTLPVEGLSPLCMPHDPWVVKNPTTIGSLWLRKFHMEEFVSFIMGVILLCEATCGLCAKVIVFKPMPCYVWTLVVFKVFVDQHRQRECLSVKNRLQTDRFPTEWKPVYMHTPTHLSVPQCVELSTFGLNNPVIFQCVVQWVTSIELPILFIECTYEGWSLWFWNSRLHKVCSSDSKISVSNCLTW